MSLVTKAKNGLNQVRIKIYTEFKMEDTANKTPEGEKSSYSIVSVDRKFIDNFKRFNPRNDQWAVNDVKWSKDKPLFTYGASTCITPVFVNRVSGEIGLGHLAYVYIDHSKTNIPVTAEEMKLEETKRKITETGNQWDLFLFNASPVDMSERYKNLARNNIEKVIEMFSGIGVTCYDKTNSDSSEGMNGLIVDPKTKQIQICTSQIT